MLYPHAMIGVTLFVKNLLEVVCHMTMDMVRKAFKCITPDIK